MKTVAIALTLLITLSAHTCNEKTATAAGGGDPVKGAKEMSSIMDSKWVLQSLGGNAVKMPEGFDTPWIKLVKDGSKVEGFGGCNNMFGGFELDGANIKFPNMGSTKKYCADTQPTETAFMGALRSTESFKMDGGMLKLLARGEELAVLKGE